MPCCSSCGRELSDEARFCPNCGAKVHNQEGSSSGTQRSDNKYESGNTDDSKTLMVLNVTKKDGFFKSSSCYFIFFKDKMVVTVMTKDRIKQENKRMQEAIKAEGLGFFKGSAAMMRQWAEYGNKYYGMTSSEIEAEAHTNFLIRCQDVSWIRFTASRDNQQGDEGQSVRSPGNLIIQHVSGRITATHKYGDPNQKIRRVLETLFGGKLKYKGAGFAIHLGRTPEGFC